jgi:hypothetical protein
MGKKRELYDAPTRKEATDFVNKLEIQKEKTFDSMIYTYTLENKNPLGTTKNLDHQFIKQPLL